MDKQTKAVLNGNLLRIEQKTAYGMFSRRLFSWDIVEIISVSIKTAQRYIRKPDVIPGPTHELLRIKGMGLIPDDAWDGWCVKDGQLISPLDKRLRPDEIENMAMIYQRARWLEMRIDVLERKNDDLSNNLDMWRAKAGYSPAANDAD